MDQYQPAGKVTGQRYPELLGRVSRSDITKAARLAEELGLRLDRRVVTRE
jgi:uncharacterized Fe-S radical SAM superfamily protein PflX